MALKLTEAAMVLFRLVATAATAALAALAGRAMQWW